MKHIIIYFSRTSPENLWYSPACRVLGNSYWDACLLGFFHLCFFFFLFVNQFTCSQCQWPLVALAVSFAPLRLWIRFSDFGFRSRGSDTEIQIQAASVSDHHHHHHRHLHLLISFKCFTFFLFYIFFIFKFFFLVKNASRALTVVGYFFFLRAFFLVAVL